MGSPRSDEKSEQEAWPANTFGQRRNLEPNKIQVSSMTYLAIAHLLIVSQDHPLHNEHVAAVICFFRKHGEGLEKLIAELSRVSEQLDMTDQVTQVAGVLTFAWFAADTAATGDDHAAMETDTIVANEPEHAAHIEPDCGAVVPLAMTKIEGVGEDSNNRIAIGVDMVFNQDAVRSLTTEDFITAVATCFHTANDLAIVDAVLTQELHASRWGRTFDPKAAIESGRPTTAYISAGKLQMYQARLDGLKKGDVDMLVSKEVDVFYATQMSMYNARRQRLGTDHWVTVAILIDQATKEGRRHQIGDSSGGRSSIHGQSGITRVAQPPQFGRTSTLGSALVPATLLRLPTESVAFPALYGNPGPVVEREVSMILKPAKLTIPTTAKQAKIIRRRENLERQCIMFRKIAGSLKTFDQVRNACKLAYLNLGYVRAKHVSKSKGQSWCVQFATRDQALAVADRELMIDEEQYFSEVMKP
ncbi:hypothetical protein LTR62_000519 [Meristemomyces frigidus]|uniref:Uncharacterized protein n=1 Tax=Meristemomyces frigidus TaxID=1508187 RepID=A0AAN7TKF4_9PEZI|nr:hypothetical protein LTR62_000519 [Meristemomyces frigidus]